MPRRIVTTGGYRGTTLVPRNPIARSPLLRKGGAHQETKTKQRRNARQALESQLEDWRDELEFERSLKEVDDE
jgi:hypothetical protein